MSNPYNYEHHISRIEAPDVTPYVFNGHVSLGIPHRYYQLDPIDPQHEDHGPHLISTSSRTDAEIENLKHAHAANDDENNANDLVNMADLLNKDSKNRHPIHSGNSINYYLKKITPDDPQDRNNTDDHSHDKSKPRLLKASSDNDHYYKEIYTDNVREDQPDNDDSISLPTHNHHHYYHMHPEDVGDHHSISNQDNRLQNNNNLNYHYHRTSPGENLNHDHEDDTHGLHLSSAMKNKAKHNHEVEDEDLVDNTNEIQDERQIQEREHDDELYNKGGGKDPKGRGNEGNIYGRKDKKHFHEQKNENDFHERGKTDNLYDREDQDYLPEKEDQDHFHERQNKIRFPNRKNSARYYDRQNDEQQYHGEYAKKFHDKDPNEIAWHQEEQQQQQDEEDTEEASKNLKYAKHQQEEGKSQEQQDEEQDEQMNDKHYNQTFRNREQEETPRFEDKISSVESHKEKDKDEYLAEERQGDKLYDREHDEDEKYNTLQDNTPQEKQYGEQSNFETVHEVHVLGNHIEKSYESEHIGSSLYEDHDQQRNHKHPGHYDYINSVLNEEKEKHADEAGVGVAEQLDHQDVKGERLVFIPAFKKGKE